MIGEKKRMILLTLISVAATLAVAFIIIGLSYQAAIDQTYLRLQDSARSQTRLIESMVRHEREDGHDVDPVAHALGIIHGAHKTYAGFGGTGEFVLASLSGDQIKFHVQQRLSLTAVPVFTAVDGAWAEPMKRALNGESGTLLAQDYRGEIVLAAYESVQGTGLGLVAKIDRQEIIDRFIPLAVGAVAIAIVVAVLSAFLFARLGDPIVQRLRGHKKSLKASVKNERRVAANLRAREAQQKAIAELGLDVLSGITLEELFSKTVTVAAEVLGMDFTKILELKMTENNLIVRAGTGWQPGIVGAATVPSTGNSQAAFTLASQAPVVVENMALEHRFSGPALLTDHGVGSGLSVIIGNFDDPWGVLGVHTKEVRSLDDTDIFFVQALANLLHTAIKRADSDAELRKWNVLFEHANWGMAIVDSTTGKLIGINPAFASMHGYTISEMEPLSMGDCLVQENGNEPGHLTGVVGSKSGITYEVRRVRKDGSVFPSIVSEVSIYGEQGDEMFLVANVQDSSEQKRIETERLAVEKKVQHAQKLESLGVLAGGIAHDFNNILMTILGNASIALQDLAPEAMARPSVDAIETAAHRAAGLAKQMLAYSGKGQFVVENLAINSLVEEMTHLLEVSVAKNVTVKYNFGSNLPLMRGDTSQISQILMNLIINASDAIGEQSGVIQVSTGVMECDRAYLDSVMPESSAGMAKPLAEGLYNYFLVSDTGCGMDAATIAKIFDPFFTTKFAGRGLGLAAMLGIVRAHRGAIKIYSQPGKGSSFKIMLPASPELDGIVEDQVTETQTLWRGTGTVLIVDDDDSIVALGKRMLERLGYTSLAAHDGVEAVDMYRENEGEVVCVILDLTMPRMSGADAFSKIVRINPSAKVILCSGYDEQQVTQDFAGRGLAGFLHKPYRLDELKQKLMEVLG